MVAGRAQLSWTPLDTIEAAKLCKEHDLDAILHASRHPSEEQAKALFAERQVYALLTKNPALRGSDPKQRERDAFSKFYNTQAKNRRTDKRLDYFFSRPGRLYRQSKLVSKVLSEARHRIFQLLGPCPTEQDWDAFIDAKVFSGGSIQGIGKYLHFTDVDAYAKLLNTTTVTSSNRCLRRFGPMLLNGYYGELLQRYRESGTLRIQQVESSKACCVPKDAVVDRFIAVEPLLNAMAQQGISAMLKPYLLKWGISLTKQTRNTELARDASRKGCSPDGLSTIDLSSASDTVTNELVRYLMPDGWYQLLCDARTQDVEVEGDVFRSSSFSTMGNAFTFPLQCLIFASLARACITNSLCEDNRWRVYGDDIILPSSASLLMMEALRFVGFLPNETKSFVVGFFRESCGGDFLLGHDVRPVYLRESLDKLTEKHSLFNRLQRKDPGNPVLQYLFESVRRPLVGPGIGPSGGETSHFVAPLWYLRKKMRLEWISDAQAYSYRYTGLFPTNRKRNRTCTVTRYATYLAIGDRRLRHDIRGTQRYAVGVRTTTTPWVVARAASFWYIL